MLLLWMMEICVKFFIPSNGTHIPHGKTFSSFFANEHEIKSLKWKTCKSNLCITSYYIFASHLVDEGKKLKNNLHLYIKCVMGGIRKLSHLEIFDFDFMKYFYKFLILVFLKMNFITIKCDVTYKFSSQKFCLFSSNLIKEKIFFLFSVLHVLIRI